MDKYECESCGKEFIVGKELCQQEPMCPYCKSGDTHWMSGTEGEHLEDLASEMGCLAIYKDANSGKEDVIQKMEIKYSENLRLFVNITAQMVLDFQECEEMACAPDDASKDCEGCSLDEDIEGTPLCELPTVIEALAAVADNINEGKN